MSNDLCGAVDGSHAASQDRFVLTGVDLRTRVCRLVTTRAGARFGERYLVAPTEVLMVWHKTVAVRLKRLCPDDGQRRRSAITASLALLA
jgi:hypothetical protein